jgi:hypothetical protein
MFYLALLKIKKEGNIETSTTLINYKDTLLKNKFFKSELTNNPSKEFTNS